MVGYLHLTGALAGWEPRSHDLKSVMATITGGYVESAEGQWLARILD
jgi:hypothetical protein